MNITFYKSASDPRTITKQLTEGQTLEGTLREESNVINPTLTIETTNEITGYNYAFIREFGRFYFIDEITAISAYLWRLSLSVDVLMSWRDAILNCPCIIDKQESAGNLYIDDGSHVLDSRKFIQSIAFGAGFPDTAEYILVTAGGGAS